MNSVSHTGYREIRNTLEQACTTYGPRAKWGPWKHLSCPAKPKMFFLDCFLHKSTIEWVKHFILALWYGQKIFSGPPKDVYPALE